MDPGTNGTGTDQLAQHLGHIGPVLIADPATELGCVLGSVFFDYWNNNNKETTTMTVVNVDQIARPEPGRDRYGRYLIEGVPHTRTTTITKTLTDAQALTNWKLRMVAKGLAQRDDLLSLASTTSLARHKEQYGFVSARADRIALRRWVCLLCE